MDQLARSNPFHVDDGDDVDDDYDDLQPDIATPTASTATGHHHQTIMTASYDEIEAAEEAEKRTMEDVSKMKEWVSLKLKELEDQNQHLKEENRKFNEELAKLKQSCLITTNTTTTSTPATSTSNEKNSIKATPTKKNKKAFTPEVSRRRFPSSRTTPHDQHHYQNSFEIQQQQQPQQPSNFRQGFESASSQRRPQQRQRRRRYISVENVVDGRRSNSSNSSSTSSSSASSSASSDDDDEEEEFFVTKSRYARHLKAAAAAASASHHSRYQHQSPTRSRALRNAQAQAQAQPRIEGAHMTLLSGHSRQLIGSANCAANRTGSLDRKLTRMRRLNFTEMKRQQQQQQKYQQQQPPQHRPHRGETKQQQQQQQQQRKQQQMTTTELETTAAAASPKTTKAVDHEVSISSKPPTPPLHRCPSWESRIYELANQGIRSAISTPVAAVKHFAVGTNTTTTTTTADSNGNHNHHHHQQQHTSATNAFFGDGEGSSSHHLPLFKNINGRLAKIPNAFTTNHNHNNNNNNTSRMTASFDENCSMSSEADLLFEGGGGGGGGTEQQSEALFTTSCLQQTLTATSNHYLNCHNSNTSSGNESDFRPLDLEQVDDAISLEEDSDDQDDYALPPDAMVMVNGSGLLREEEEERPKTPQRTASTRAPPPGTAFPVSEMNSIVKPSPVGEKCGYLLKLSGKGRFVRTWKRRWFVLKDGGHLSYYRSEEAYQKGEAPSAKTATPILLEPSSVRLHRPETKESDLKSTLANTFQLHYSVTEEEGGKKSSKKDEKKKKRKKKVLTLSADSRQTLADWLRLLNQTLTANGISRLLQANEGAPPSIEGPLVRVRLGVSTRLWAALYGQHLVYYLSSSSSSSSADNNSSSSKTPIGYTALKGAKVQQIESFEGEEMGPPSSADHSEHATLRMKKDHLGLGNRTGTTPPPSLATPTLTISIHAVDNSCEPVYLRLATKQQCEQWACQLKHAASPSFTPAKRASPSALLKKMTVFEEALGVLRSLEAQCPTEEFYSSAAWSAPALCYSEEASLVEALTSAADCSQALKLFKALQLFISVPLVEVNLGGGGNATLNSPAIDYHVALAQNVLKMGLEGGAALQTELLLQLIKQSSPEGRLRRQVLLQSSGAGNSVTTTSSFSSNSTSTSSPFHLRQLLSCASATAGHSSSWEKSPPYSSSEFSSAYPDASGGLSPSDRRKYSAIFVQAFQLLALAISIFQPRGSALWLLRHHLRRCRQHQTDENLGSGSEVGQLAAYCERALARVLQRGGRRQIASRMEVLSILQRNPNKHSMPHRYPPVYIFVVFW